MASLTRISSQARPEPRCCGRVLPGGGVVALRRRGAAPAADEVLRRHRRQQQAELQHRGGAQLRHGRGRWVWRV